MTTLEDVNARVQRGCKCSGKNCFKDVSPDIILTLRNSKCTLTKAVLCLRLSWMCCDGVDPCYTMVEQLSGSSRVLVQGPLTALRWTIQMSAKWFSLMPIA